MRFPVGSIVAVTLAVGLAPLAAAAPESASTTGTTSPMKRYQSRLEAETARILTLEVQGAMKDTLGRKGTELWACMSVDSWQRLVTADAPSLARSCQVLARRAEVICAEERLSDAYTSPIVQMASVHAMQRGLSSVLALLGVKMAPPPPMAAAPPPNSASAPAQRQPIAASHASTPTAAPAATAAAILSPAQLAEYTATLEREAYRILSVEVSGVVLDGVVARRASLRTATTVASWRDALVASHPALARAAAVLVRRTEVLRGDLHVLDAYDSAANQRAAVRGLQSGLDRVLRSFGK